MANTMQRDYKETLFLPKTSFAMKAGLPKLEPALQARWDQMQLYDQQRVASRGKPKFILHDGPPYANGDIHIGHAMNKILKDIINRSQQMSGKDAPYVPGWDCHGLPIEWQVEENFRAKGKKKEDIPRETFRRECRIWAAEWINKQSKQFQRLGVLGDWEKPYTTMSFDAESKIIAEFLHIARSGQLKRGSKPVMWSPVEQTALAEAEIEYHDKVSTTIWVRFPLSDPDLNADIIIWTTTPWTIPGNRAICFGPKLSYGLYEIESMQEITHPKTGEKIKPWGRPGQRLILADKLAEDIRQNARIESWKRLEDVKTEKLANASCHHPLRSIIPGNYDFDVPLLPGGHVTDDSGTGFVHTAPGHGAEDFEAVRQNLNRFPSKFDIPFTVDAAGRFTETAGHPLTGLAILETEGKKLGRDGPANNAVIALLIDAEKLLARGRIEHSYPHSWRSKAPVIFRNTPQWFISVGDAEDPKSLRAKALSAVDETEFYPATSKNRLRSMLIDRPDWLVSRQRAWGVPLTLFVHRQSGELLHDPRIDQCIIDAVSQEGADAWYNRPAQDFLGTEYDPADYEKIEDILDVWFDSGSTHAFVLEARSELSSPAEIYLEGSDQHRGWFQSSLLESCATRDRAPFKAIFTHGFTVDEKGKKMSKSLGNVVDPLKICNEQGAEILRLWVASANVVDDLRVGRETLKTAAGSYRKLRNTLRYLCGALDGYQSDKAQKFPVTELPELERYMLHRLTEVSSQVQQAFKKYDLTEAFHLLMNFCSQDLSSFYFDIRKDRLYCDPPSSPERQACLFVLDQLFAHLIRLLAPIFPFTTEEAWLARNPESDSSIHLTEFLLSDDIHLDIDLANKWHKIKQIRSVILGALEIERAEKRIGSSLEAAPVLYLLDAETAKLLDGLDMAEISITSQFQINICETLPDSVFQLSEHPNIGVRIERAQGKKCARSWRILPEVGSDPDFPDLSLRDAAAVREWDKQNAA